jgi:hypothetical protein
VLDGGKANRFLELRDGARFEQFCKAVLQEESPRFQAYAPPDRAIDAYDADSETVYQFYFPEGAPRKDKIVKDIRKVLDSKQHPKRWALVMPKDPTPTQVAWVEHEFRNSSIKPEIWGQTKLGSLLRKHPAVSNEFFPTEVGEVLRKLAKGKKPAFGDADDWRAVSAEEREELRETIQKLAEESAKRKHRKVLPRDFACEFAEFNAHFRLSEYGRLRKEEIGSARRYLDEKLYARRKGEPIRQTRARHYGGIKAIARKLGLSETHYREELRLLTGLTSLSRCWKATKSGS